MNRRAGFTLIEILVSLMIFSVVSVAMLGIMFMATELYRRGETGRAANDETVAVLAALDDDLTRVVPAAAGGWIYAEVDPPAADLVDADRCGGTLLAFKITSRDRSLVDASGQGTQTIVAWWVDRKADTFVLRRAERPTKPRTPDPSDDEDIETLDEMMDEMVTNPDAWPAITSGCLYFGAYLSADGNVRVMDDDWYGSGALPATGTLFCTGPGNGQPFPEAIRVTTVLTGGGRFASTGRLIADISPSADSLRIAGIKAVPTASGSMLRVGDEWIGYDGYDGKTISLTSASSQPWVGRGMRRSAKTTHPAQAVVRLGQTHSLVRLLR